MSFKPAGLGRKHPQLDIPVTKLFLDAENPRLPEEVQGKRETELLHELHQSFSLDELAYSMANNGYLDEEPMVAIPQKLPRALEKVNINSEEFLQFIRDEKTLFTVVEGNRRLATVKILLSVELRDSFRIKNWPTISKAIKDDISILPVIIYQKRNDIVPYLGVRHIVGIQKWDSYAKARYIAKMIDGGLEFKQIEAQIPDKTSSLLKNYICYKILEQANNEFQFDTVRAKNDFSLLLLSIGQGNIKRFIGLPTKLSDANPNEPIPVGKLKNLRTIIVWLFGNGKGRPVINESRDITNYLSSIVASEEAVLYLQKTGNILEAYDRTDGEEKMVLKYLNRANKELETVLSVVHRHRTYDVLTEVEKCDQTVKALLKLVRETNDPDTRL
jgi:hypothetical protein